MPHYIQYINNGRIDGWTATSEYQSDWAFVEFPTSGIENRAGNPPSIEGDTGFYLFAQNQVQTVLGSIHFDHNIDIDGDFYPVVKWSKTTSASGGVTWGLQSRIIRAGQVIPAYSSLEFATESELFKNDDTADKYAIDVFPKKDTDIFSGEGDAFGAIFNFQLTRQTGDAGDTYGTNARLLAFGIYMQIDTLGSETLFQK